MSESELNEEQERQQDSLERENQELHNKKMFLLNKIREYVTHGRTPPPKLMRELEFVTSESDENIERICKFLDSL